MEFKQFKQMIQTHFEEMTKDATHLFEVEVDRDEMWDIYLESFPSKFNKVYRERREHDCSCCRHFIKNIGNVVVIKDYKVTTLWDFEIDSEEYSPSVKALKDFITSKAVSNIYVSKFNSVGTDSNKELFPSGDIHTWEHHYLQIPSRFVDSSARSEGDIKGQYRDVRNVFKRSLDELSVDSIETILELIMSNTLYKGEEWKTQLQSFLKLKKAYDLISPSKQEAYAWEHSVKVGAVIGKIRNHSIGTLLVNVTEGMELDLAVKKYEQIVAPTNYKRPQAIYTKKMLEDAKKTIEELGFMDSLERRFATLDDITVNNILFSNKDAGRRIKGANILDEMLAENAINPKKFSTVEEVQIEKFIQDVLPSVKEMEVLVEGKHTPNMVSLIAPKNAESNVMLKWDNNFSWAYSGNITDSDMKDRVKSAGGNVDGVLRFSIQWNEDGRDNNDLDAHCVQPDLDKIFFGTYKGRESRLSGALDVDIQTPMSDSKARANGGIAVENITFNDKSKMMDGDYSFFVHGYSNRGGTNGFRAEIEFNGELHSFDYNKNIKTGELIKVAVVSLKNGVFTIKNLLSSSSAVKSKEVWGVNTNQFVPVSVMMFSPNYWNEQSGIGNKHYMFMLKDCVNPEMPSGFFNEYLKEDLMKHKKVFEALSGKMRVEDVEDQLSGLGFSSTKRNDVVVKIKGNSERVIKIKF